MLTNLILAVLPTIIIMLFIFIHDRFEKEPAKLIATLFLGGCISVVPAIVLSDMMPVFGTSYLAFYLYKAFVGIALIEELCKYAAVMALGYNRKHYNEIYDGIIYCAVVALGFATVENILYVIEYGTTTAVLRAVTAVPAHAMFGVSMGYYMSLAKINPLRKRFYMLKSLLSAIVLHGIYDFILFTDYDFMLFIFVPYLIGMYYRSIKLIRSTYDIEPFA